MVAWGDGGEDKGDENKTACRPLTSMAHLAGHRSAKQKVTGSIPGQHMSGLWARSPVGGTQEVTY